MFYNSWYNPWFRGRRFDGFNPYFGFDRGFNVLPFQFRFGRNRWWGW